MKDQIKLIFINCEPVDVPAIPPEKFEPDTCVNDDIYVVKAERTNKYGIKVNDFAVLASYETYSNHIDKLIKLFSVPFRENMEKK